MTITESKKFSNEDGSAHYKKHKIYLYKEDFDEFKKSFEEVSDFIFEKKVEKSSQVSSLQVFQILVILKVIMKMRGLLILTLRVQMLSLKTCN